VLYFAYGSNMDVEEVRSSCPGAELRCTPARLDGYEFDFRRLSQRRQGGASDIVRRANANLFGCVWEIPVAERAALDRREGVPNAYRPLTVTLSTARGHIRAFTYTAANKAPDPVPPTAEYAQLILNAARERRLPLDYRARLEALMQQLGVVV
jgi:cation transport regulator ChaC